MTNKQRFLQIYQDRKRELQQDPNFISLHIVGSIRRGKEHPRDLDLLLCVQGVSKVVLPPKEDKPKLGPFGYQDTFVCREESLGAALVMTTGPRVMARRLTKLALIKKLRLNYSGLYEDNILIPTPTELDLFLKLGLKLVPPDKREAYANTLGIRKCN